MKGTINEEYLLKLCKLGTIAELEKIKAEMESRVKLNNDLENYDIATGLSMALGILDKHIYELEGDSK